MLGLINFDSIIMIYMNWRANAKIVLSFSTKKDVDVFTENQSCNMNVKVR
jgi:hypothetical protein